MIKPTMIFALCFLTAFAAGISSTLMWQRYHNYEQDGWLKDLHLSQDQREKIKNIWTDAMKNSNAQAQREKREAAARERDDALKAMAGPEQKDRLEEILHTYHTKVDDLSAESKKARDEATERTKAVLTEEQRVVYDELRKKRQESRSKGRSDTATATSTEKTKTTVDDSKQQEPSQSKGEKQ